MRIWVLLTQNMKVYVFKEGHLKTCSVKYDLNTNDAFTHITNYSFQKYNSNFQKFEKGNEVPFYEFQKFLDKQYPDKKFNIKTDLINKIKEIIKLTMRAAKDKINKNNRQFQFEIFGYDFMLDKDFNLFLIEINTNPGLEESSPWIKIIVPRMLDDCLRLTIDTSFDPRYDFSKNYKPEDNTIKIVSENLKKGIDPNNVNVVIGQNNKENEKESDIKSYNNKYISPFPVPGYQNHENLWDLVVDLNERDPLDDNLDKDLIDKYNENRTFTGIRHLLRKKNKKIDEIKKNEEKKEENKINKENEQKEENKINKENEQKRTKKNR